jgi:hypothetical protein
MAFVIADRVRETSTTVGTGSITLAGAVTGYQTFASVLASSDTTYYTIADQTGANWEVGIGTFTSPSTLARTTILSSSNAGSVVTFTSGTKDVFISLPSSKTNVKDQPNTIDVNSSSTALRVTQIGSGSALVVEDSANPDSTPFVVDATGNVGVGLSSPAAKFDLVGSYKEGVVTANTGTTYTISLASGTLQILTLTGNCVFTFPTPTAGFSFTLFLKQDATGSRTATWPASVKWPSSTAPTITSTASKGDKYIFTADGTYWWGSNAGQNYL